MLKNFDEWNNYKKRLDEVALHKLCQERDVWWCSLGVNVGFEENGTGTDSERPVLILKVFSKEVCLIVPLSTSLKTNPYYIEIGQIEDRKASVILSQVRLIDTKRLSNKITQIPRKKFNIIRQAIKEYL